MAQYGEQYVKEEGRGQGQYTEEYGQNPLRSNTAAGYDIGGTETTIGTGTGRGAGQGQGYDQLQGKKDGAAGGSLYRSSEDDEEGGRRKKEGVMEEKLPGAAGGDYGAGGGDYGACDEQETTNTATVGGGGGGYGYEGQEGGHEKKGLMEKIKDKLPGTHQ